MIYCVILIPGIGARREVVASKFEKANGGWIKLRDNTWLISTNRKASAWRDEVRPYIGIGGTLMIIRAQREWAGLKGPIADWLHRHSDDF